MYKLKFYSKSILEHLFIPNFYYQKQLQDFLSKDQEWMTKILIPRVNYYFKRKTKFDFSGVNFSTLRSLSCFNKSAYYYDIRSVLRYFPANYKFGCWLRDVINVPNKPRFVKCRPINEDNENSAILKLRSSKALRVIRDQIKFRDKKPKLVWRGIHIEIGGMILFIDISTMSLVM